MAKKRVRGDSSPKKVEVPHEVVRTKTKKASQKKSPGSRPDAAMKDTQVKSKVTSPKVRCVLSKRKEPAGASQKKSPGSRPDAAMKDTKVKSKVTSPKVRGKSAISQHKASLEKLKDQDPEFYKFLQKEDASLLNFNDSSSDDDGEDLGDEDEVDKDDGDDQSTDEDDQSEDEDDQSTDEDDQSTDEDEDDDRSDDGMGGEYVHKLPTKLEVASDDSNPEDSDDEEAEGAKRKTKKETQDKYRGTAIIVTPKMINAWSQSLQETASVAAMLSAIAAFKAAVQETGTDGDTEGSKFKVEGSTVFNAVVRLCLRDLLPAFNHFLQLPVQKNADKPVLPSTMPRWNKLRVLIKSYLTDLLQMMAQIGEATILNALLKHVHQLCGYFVCVPKLARALLRRGITIWSSGEETSRVLAFLIVNRVTRYMKEHMLEFTLKKMYLAYVKNCKFTSPNTLPLINFMQRSLVEILAMNLQLTYQYAFVYIRQLAIHLRNAITMKKKENSQAVYNWQFMHSLHFWARALAELCPSDILDPLVYPLTQTIIGTIKLVPTARYYPLRFHGVKSLNILSQATNNYIPVLPFLLEVFELTDFNKKHKNLSFKPLNFAVILKLSNSQLTEKGFRDGVVDQLYELLLEQFHIHAHTVSFPELALPAIVQLKLFIKQCKVSNYTKQMKQILDKVEANSKTISQRRKTATFNLADTIGVVAWEARSRSEGTPLSKYYDTWRKLRDRELQHEIAGKERISTDDLPEIVRPMGPRKASMEDRKDFAELFDTDSECEEGDDETRFLLKNERPRKKQKTRDDYDDNDVGNFSDFDSDELEELARSGDEGEDEEDSEDDADSEADDEDEDDSEDDKVQIKQKTSKQKQKASSKVSPATTADDADDPDDIVEDFTMSDDET